ncbi:MAG: AAA family ATPase [Dehalococcoidia bacterium]
MVALGKAADVFVGREAELDTLRTELEHVQAGAPRVVLVEGPAGIGKTALVDHFLRVDDEILVLRANGEPWEATVPFGVLDQLTRAADVSRASILARREHALPFDEPIAVGAAILDLLSELDSEHPIVILINDAQWSDLDSLRALLFVLRRLVADRVLTVLTVRSEDEHRLPEGLRRMAEGQAGTTIQLSPLDARQVRALAVSLGLPEFSHSTAERLAAHTEGNPLYVRALLSEVPADRWRDWQPVLPAPRAFAALVARRLDSCGPSARRLVEAAAVLGGTASLTTAVALAEVDETAAALADATALNLLQLRDEPGVQDVMFSHPLVHAAVHGQMDPLRRSRLHRRAAELLQDEGATLRHRVAAAGGADAQLADDLVAFAGAQEKSGALASAASALMDASRLSPTRAVRESRLLQAMDAMIGAGDLRQASNFAGDVARFPATALRDAVLGYLAVVRGRSSEAENLLRGAWKQVGDQTERSVSATVAHRLALHSVGRIDAADVVEWARRAISLAAPGDAVRAEAHAVLGLGLAWLGRLDEGLAAHRSGLNEIEAPNQSGLPPRIRMATGWMLLADGDVLGARDELTEMAPDALAGGSVRVSLWAYIWLALTDYTIGSWDDAVVNAERALALLGDSGHAWLRPLARWAATLVPAARGDWPVAEEHVRLATAESDDDYELMIVGAALAGAHLAAARGDAGAVLDSLAPMTEMASKEAIEEPGFWPWCGMYGDALVSTGLLDEADTFLDPREIVAAERGRNVEIARLARVRGRLEAARGNAKEAEEAFEHGLAQFERHPVPFEKALVELAYGQTLRRSGKRRMAAARLRAAADGFAILGARPYMERCDRELVACGLSTADRRTFDVTRLTAQELAVARLVASGLTNREVAAEMFVSIKTVQFHLTHIYMKLGIRSRTDLAARWGEIGADAGGRSEPPVSSDAELTPARGIPDQPR